MTNYQTFTEQITPVENINFEPLDAKYMQVHLIGTILSYFVLMAAALLLLLLENPWFCIATECVLAICFAVNISLIPKACRFKGYAFRRHDLTYRTGLVFPKLTTIPYQRIQQVSLRRNPISKLFGLCSVEIVNGAQSFASLKIPGLSEEKAGQIRNLLTEQLNSTHD